MTKEEIFNYFYTNSINLGIRSILMIMLGALIIAAIIYLTYWETYKGVSYNNKFNISLIALTLISVVIMLMISSNIVISLGMVGALSIIRFRTAIKDSRDTVFIFWAIAEGLCVGSQNFKLAILTTLFIAVVFMAASYILKIYNKYLLVITGRKQPINIEEVIKIIQPYIVTSKVKTVNKSESMQEMIIQIKTKGEINLYIVEQLLKVSGIKSVNWISESGDIVG